MRRIAILAASTAAISPRAFASNPPTDTAAKPKADRVAPQMTSTFKVDLPKPVSRRGSESIYPFATLTEVGMAFGVKNKDKNSLSSIVSNANKKARIPVNDANGNPTFETKDLTAQDGSVTRVPDTSKPITTATAHYYAVDVDKALAAKIKGSPLEGSKALIVRDL